MTRTKEKSLHPNLLSSTFYHKSHQSTILKGFHSLWEKDQLLDVALIVEGRIFKAHKVILSACSDYFRAMFTNNMLESRQDEINLNGVTAVGFHQILEYIYTSRIALNLSNIQDVLEAATHVQMEPVIQACSKYLLSQVDIENCIDIVTIAETYSLDRLRLRVYRFMSENLVEFFNSREVYRLSSQQMENLLVLDFPVNCSESEVLRIVMAWFLQGDVSKREFRFSCARSILRCIHFNEISRPEMDAVFNKLFQERSYDWELYKMVLSETYLQTKSTDITNTSSLVNSRGMELAVLKIGGFGIGGITNEITYCFSSERKWKHLTTIPHVEQCNFGTSVLNNELYIVGGCFNQSLQENIHPFGFKYSPQYDKWSTMSPMKIERCRFSLNVLGNMLYAVGGASEVDEYGTSTAECYDPVVDMWYMIKALPAYLTQHAGATYEYNLDLKLFISGGMDRDSIQSSMYCYTVGNDQWQQCAPMLRARADHVMLSIGGYLYVCGGWTEGADGRSRVLVDTIDVYDIKKDCWKVLTTVPTPRYHAGIVCVDCKIYFIGGFYSDDMFDKSTAAIECYDIEAQTWTTEEKYPQDIWEHTCASLFIPRWRDDMQDMQVIAKMENV